MFKLVKSTFSLWCLGGVAPWRSRSDVQHRGEVAVPPVAEPVAWPKGRMSQVLVLPVEER